HAEAQSLTDRKIGKPRALDLTYIDGDVAAAIVTCEFTHALARIIRLHSAVHRAIASGSRGHKTPSIPCTTQAPTNTSGCAIMAALTRRPSRPSMMRLCPP